MTASAAPSTAAVVCATLCSAVFAQDSPEERLERALERCSNTPTAEQHVACLEAALEIAYLAPEADALPAAAAAPAADPVSPATPDADRFGAAQVAARAQRGAPEEPARMSARVEKVSIVPYRRLEVQLDNGQVWRQLQGDTQRITVRGAQSLTVDIWESRMGGYQMRLHELGRTIRVERLR